MGEISKSLKQWVLDKKLHVKICQKCNARNSWRAEKCGKCGRGELRPKSAGKWGK